MAWTSRHRFRRLYESEFRQPQDLPTLPSDYISFLNKFNGVKFETGLKIDVYSGMTAPPENPLDWFVLSVLYGTCSDEEDDFLDLVRCQNDYHFSKWNKGKLVSIGGTHSFNELCLSIREEDFGSVYHWQFPSDSPTEADLAGEEWRDFTLEKLAASFSEFWGKLDLFAIPDSET